jgi:hypothetical protein
MTAWRLSQQVGEVVEADRDIWMVRPEALLLTVTATDPKEIQCPPTIKNPCGQVLKGGACSSKTAYKLVLGVHGVFQR